MHEFKSWIQGRKDFLAGQKAKLEKDGLNGKLLDYCNRNVAELELIYSYIEWFENIQKSPHTQKEFSSAGKHLENSLGQNDIV